MGDKDSPLDRLFDSKERLITFLDVTDGKRIGDRIIADSLVTESELESSEAQKPAFGSYSFDYTTDGTDIPDALLGICKEPQTFLVDVTVGGEPYIYRPDNLKHPNKKRARRIWKKWAKRYGVRPTQKCIIPKAQIVVTPEDNGSCRCQITASK